MGSAIQCHDLPIARVKHSFKGLIEAIFVALRSIDLTSYEAITTFVETK